jgi:hypothetical protein
VVLDRLVALALDAGRPEAARVAALDALADVGGGVLGPVWERLRDDPNIAVRQRAGRETGQGDPLSELEAAAQGALGDDPAAVQAAVEAAGAQAALPTLHRLVELVRARGDRERALSAKAGWLVVRGALHLALAARESRVALYDVRETIERATSPLPAGFVQAVAAVGDAASLEALAGAYAAAGAGSGNTAWQRELADAFERIAEREHVSRRHPVARRIETKWPEAAALLLSTLSRSTRASKPASRTSGTSR